MRTVTTLEEVKALPYGTVLLERDTYCHMVCQKHGDGWYRTTDPGGPDVDYGVALPATVIYTPQDSADA